MKIYNAQENKGRLGTFLPGCRAGQIEGMVKLVGS